jgi:YHS domain-containing protein
MMLRFILFILLFILLYNVLHFFIKNMSFIKRTMDRKSEPEELVQDPYCQTYIPKRSALKKRVAGKDYYFCNRECLKKYLKRESS